MCAMPIGDLARRTDTPVATIRYYEEIGLMPIPARSAAGRRLYGAEDVARLDFIRSCRALGYSLKDVGRALQPLGDCAPNLDQARDQLARLRRQIDRLQTVALTLESQIAACQTGCMTLPDPGCLILPA